ncbi:hypothetical protein [Methanobacterium sp.]|uniref:hypothetical protein n=1 Tax=Methanobacterium sp. TaxID=2164 RepID=UPI003C75F016
MQNSTNFAVQEIIDFLQHVKIGDFQALNKIGRSYHAVSPEIEKLLGIKGSIQRSIPPRMIKGHEYVENLKILLKI